MKYIQASVFLLIAVSAVCLCSINDLLTAMTPTATSPGCISYSAYVDKLSPDYGATPSYDLQFKLLNILVSQTPYRCIMIYDMSGIHVDTVKIAAQLGIKVLGHVYISPTFTISNVQQAIDTANTYRDTILGIACGSEVGYQNNNLTGTLNAVTSCKQQMRQGGVTQPIGYIDIATVWCSGAEDPCVSQFQGMPDVVDFIGVNEFPWWENTYSEIFTCIPAEKAAAQTMYRFDQVRNLYQNTGKPVILTEHGWPSSKSNAESILSTTNVHVGGNQCGIANPSNQKLVNQQVINTCAQRGLACNLFTSFSEEWKAYGVENDVNGYWGICGGDAPYACTNVPTGSNGDASITTSSPTTSQVTTTTTTTTTTDAPCWTCPAGQVHWSSDIGVERPSDRCACLTVSTASTTTTSAPTTTTTTSAPITTSTVVTTTNAPSTTAVSTTTVPPTTSSASPTTTVSVTTTASVTLPPSSPTTTITPTATTSLAPSVSTSVPVAASPSTRPATTITPTTTTTSSPSITTTNSPTSVTSTTTQSLVSTTLTPTLVPSTNSDDVRSSSSTLSASLTPLLMSILLMFVLY